MTAKHLLIAAAAALSMTPAASAQFMGGGPGIVMSGSMTPSQLPKAAKAFLARHYKNVGVTKAENEFAKFGYEIDLANGVEIEFNRAGKVKSIDAPDNGKPLSEKVVKDILPHKAYQMLKKAGQIHHVDEIDLENGKVYKIETRTVKSSKYTYDVSRDIWQIEYDD